MTQYTSVTHRHQKCEPHGVDVLRASETPSAEQKPPLVPLETESRERTLKFGHGLGRPICLFVELHKTAAHASTVTGGAVLLQHLLPCPRWPLFPSQSWFPAPAGRRLNFHTAPVPNFFLGACPKPKLSRREPELTRNQVEIALLQ